MALLFDSYIRYNASHSLDFIWRFYWGGGGGVTRRHIAIRQHKGRMKMGNEKGNERKEESKRVVTTDLATNKSILA